MFARARILLALILAVSGAWAQTGLLDNRILPGFRMRGNDLLRLTADDVRRNYPSAGYQGTNNVTVYLEDWSNISDEDFTKWAKHPSGKAPWFCSLKKVAAINAHEAADYMRCRLSKGGGLDSGYWRQDKQFKVADGRCYIAEDEGRNSSYAITVVAQKGAVVFELAVGADRSFANEVTRAVLRKL